MTQLACKTCRFFVQPFKQWDLDDVGECRRHPPIVHYIQTQDSNRPSGELTIQSSVGFVHVRETDWCGEHQERADEHQ